MNEWKPPTDFPRLRGAKHVAIDCETRDPNLKTKGPGGARGDGYVIGVSVATDTGVRGYWPIRHEEGPNVDIDQCKRWLADELSGPEPKVGANVIYDLEWLRAEGVHIAGPKLDIQIAEPLLNEELPSYSLQTLAERYLGESKVETGMIEAAAKIGIKEKDVKSNLWRLPSTVVGPYGEADADLALRIFEKQQPKLEAEELMPVFDLETGLVDLLLEMRFKGIPVDVPRAEELMERLITDQKEAQKRLNRLARAGSEGLDVWSGKQLADACRRLKLEYPLTDKGNPSLTAPWLTTQTDEFFQLVLNVRQLDRYGSVFIQSKILDLQVNGRVHPVYYQTRGDDGGTRSGRFSAAKPNPQQVPTRNPKYGKLIRSLFIPEDGCRWGKFDYSSQEPRVTLHYAALLNLTGAAEAARLFNEKPRTDYHQLTADMSSRAAGREVPRKQAKSLNLGLAYGMGRAKLATELGLSEAEASSLFKAYHTAVGYMQELGRLCADQAARRGYVKTILGRRCHFNLFGPPGFGSRKRPLPYEEAIQAYGQNVARYFTHKALNRVVQGSSADMIKKAMLDLYHMGYVPHITVHDELDISIDNDNQIMEIIDVMTNVMPDIKIPLVVDSEIGKSWGELEEFKHDY